MKYRALIFSFIASIAINASADKYGRFIISSGDTGKGLIYEVQAGSVNNADNITSYTNISTNTLSTTGTAVGLWLWNTPARGYKFNSWQTSNNPALKLTQSSTGAYTIARLTLDNTNTADNPQVETITAIWENDQAYNITYQKPTNGLYTVNYSYIEVNSAGNALVNGSFSNTIASGDKNIASYATDVVTLSTTLDSFTGWYDGNGNLLSTSNPYTLPINKSMTVTARFSSSAAGQAEVIGPGGLSVTYPTLAEAITEVNKTGGQTIRLKDNIIGVNESLVISKTTTLDLNGKTLHGNIPSLLNINGNGASVTIKGEGNIISSFNSTETASGITVTNGVLNILGGNISVSNEASSPNSTNGIYIASGQSLTLVGGNLSISCHQKAFGINSAGTVDIQNGEVKAETLSGSDAFGVFLNSNATFSMENGSVIANSAESNANGIYVRNSATANIEGGNITATAAINKAYGVDIFGTCTTTNGTILSSALTNSYSLFTESGSATTINGGKFIASANSNYANINATSSGKTVVLNGGYYSLRTNIPSYINETKSIYDIVEIEQEYDEGFRYHIADKDLEGIYVATTAGEYFTNLHEAISTAQEWGEKWVVLVNDVELEEDLTIPAGINLVIPYSEKYDFYTGLYTMTSAEGVDRYTDISAYRSLKLKDGVNIKVENAASIGIGGQQTPYMGSTLGGPGSVSGTYGFIDMSNGGTITLESGASLYVWGFIIGQNMSQGTNSPYSDYTGRIIAKNGSTIYEGFAINDWRGGGRTACLGSEINTYKAFPFQQYSIPNIEVPLTLEKGAHEQVTFNVQGGGSIATLTFALFDTNNAMFNIGSGSVTKWYDPTTDYMRIDVNGDFAIDKIAMTTRLDGNNSSDDDNLALNSSRFILPITSNMDITINNGCLSIPSTTEAAILPGAKVTLGKDATANIAGNLYLYDVDDWGRFSFGNYFYKTYESRPTLHFNRGNGSDISKLSDAELVIDGKMSISGGLYTTNGGASIRSNASGQITYANTYLTPTTNNTLYQLVDRGDTPTDFGPMEYTYHGTDYAQYCTPVQATPAILQNGNGTITNTLNAVASETYNYKYGQWSKPANVDNAFLTVYAGKETAETELKTIAEFKEIQKTSMNAIAIATVDYADIIYDEAHSNGLTNIIVEYPAGKHGEAYYECENFVLTDASVCKDATKTSFYSPVRFTAIKGNYNINVTRRNNPTCLPFELSLNDLPEGANILTFAYYKAIFKNGVFQNGAYIYFNKRDKINAGVPCLIYENNNSNRTYEFTFNNTEIIGSPDNSANMQGTFIRTPEFSTGKYYMLSSDGGKESFAPMNSGYYLAPFRSCLSLSNDTGFDNNHGSSDDYDDDTINAKVLNIVIIGEEGEFTTIDGVKIEPENNEGIYTLSGTKVSKITKPGMYIINGVKTLVR